MPDANATARPPSSPPSTVSKASQVSVASLRLYRRSVPSTKFDAGTSGVFSGAPGALPGRPPTMAHVSGFISLLEQSELAPVVGRAPARASGSSSRRRLGRGRRLRLVRRRPASSSGIRAKSARSVASIAGV